MPIKSVPWTPELEARLCQTFSVERKRLGGVLVAFFGVYRSRLTDWKDRGIPRGRLHEVASRKNVPFEWLVGQETRHPSGVSEPRTPLAHPVKLNLARRLEDQDPKARELVKRIRDMIEAGANEEINALLTMATSILAGRDRGLKRRRKRA